MVDVNAQLSAVLGSLYLEICQQQKVRSFNISCLNTQPSAFWKLTKEVFHLSLKPYYQEKMPGSWFRSEIYYLIISVRYQAQLTPPIFLWAFFFPISKILSGGKKSDSKEKYYIHSWSIIDLQQSNQNISFPPIKYQHFLSFISFGTYFS